MLHLLYIDAYTHKNVANIYTAEIYGESIEIFKMRTFFSNLEALRII